MWRQLEHMHVLSSNYVERSRFEILDIECSDDSTVTGISDEHGRQFDRSQHMATAINQDCEFIILHIHTNHTCSYYRIQRTSFYHLKVIDRTW